MVNKKEKKGNWFRRASSTTEYMALIIFVLTGFFIFQHYILRGAMGRWKSAGDAFGYGRQFDPRPFSDAKGVLGKGGGTLECFYSEPIGKWVSTRCYQKNCNCLVLPEATPQQNNNCKTCLGACSEDQDNYEACKDNLNE